MGVGVDDGYSSQNCAMTTVNVLDNTPTTPTNLQNTTVVFWINWTWNVSAGNIDDYDTQINGSSNAYA